MKTRKLTEIEKSIVLGHADCQGFLAACANCKTGSALSAYSPHWVLKLARTTDELALYLDSVTVEVE